MCRGPSKQWLTCTRHSVTRRCLPADFSAWSAVCYAQITSRPACLPDYSLLLYTVTNVRNKATLAQQFAVDVRKPGLGPASCFGLHPKPGVVKPDCRRQHLTLSPRCSLHLQSVNPSIQPTRSHKQVAAQISRKLFSCQSGASCIWRHACKEPVCWQREPLVHHACLVSQHSNQKSLSRFCHRDWATATRDQRYLQ